jgi:hypothetical protein
MARSPPGQVSDRGFAEIRNMGTRQTTRTMLSAVLRALDLVEACATPARRQSALAIICARGQVLHKPQLRQSVDATVSMPGVQRHAYMRMTLPMRRSQLCPVSRGWMALLPMTATAGELRRVRIVSVPARTAQANRGSDAGQLSARWFKRYMRNESDRRCPWRSPEVKTPVHMSGETMSGSTPTLLADHRGEQRLRRSVQPDLRIVASCTCAAVVAVGGRRCVSRCVAASSRWARRPAVARMAAARGTAVVGLWPCCRGAAPPTASLPPRLAVSK